MAGSESDWKMMTEVFAEASTDEGFSPEGFEIIEELDRGGMAVVYLARQLNPPRDVALKMILPRFVGEEEVRERFRREGQAMAALDYPNVLPVYQVGEWDGLVFLAMKLARGGTLQSRLSEGLPEISEAVDWVMTAGKAVHFAHQRGVLHRDLKPGNLLFDEGGTIYVGDFGVAKLEFTRDNNLTRTEAIVGTPNYLAPEVAAGTDVGGSVLADLYGLAAVLYECLTGRRPHDGAENLAAQLRLVVDEDLTAIRKLRPEIPRDLALVCEKALAKKPEHRYRTVAEFTDDLRRWREGMVVSARSTTLAERAWRWARRHPLPSFLAASLVLVALTGAVTVMKTSASRGEALHRSLIEQAKGEHLKRIPGFRKRTFALLQEAGKLKGSTRLREEAVAAMAYWDVAEESQPWEPIVNAGPYEIMPSKDGVRLLDKETGEEQWFIPGGVLRCTPVWSPDGRFLALVRGDRMEIVIYDVNRKKRFSDIDVTDWPESLYFEPQGGVLRAVFRDGEASLLDIRGTVLLDNFRAQETLVGPIGVTAWRGQHLTPLEANPYGGELSKDEKYLLTRSALGIQIWDVGERRATGFYEVGNQLVDAPTDAWWLGEKKILLQVPGALETLNIDSQGRLLAPVKLQRVPGTRVETVFDNGDWLVTVRDEDGEEVLELWPGGDFEQARELDKTMNSFDALSQGVSQPSTATVVVDDWWLTLPEGEEVLQVFLCPKRVVVLTKDYQIYDWNLSLLARSLREVGLLEEEK